MAFSEYLNFNISGWGQDKEKLRFLKTFIANLDWSEYGNVTHDEQGCFDMKYQVSWKEANSGTDIQSKVNESEISLDNLSPCHTYNVSISPLFSMKEGKPTIIK